MKKQMLMLVACVILAVGVAGCVTSTDPVTGQKQVSVDPNVAAQAEAGAEAATAILALLTPFLPWAGVISTALLSILGTWLKMKPKLVRVQSEAEMYHSAASSTVLGIEEFKKAYPDEWGKLEMKLDILKDEIISPEDRLKIENVIRGLRGLSSKA